MASRSASEYTAAVAMPSSRQARITRIAISPRLATRIFLNVFDFKSSSDREQRLVGAHDLAFCDVDVAHRAGNRRDDVVLHLHRLEDGDDVAELHVVARTAGDLDDETLPRPAHGALA